MPGIFDSGGGPDFSLAGMLMGGRGYASNWFSQRDQMAWKQAEQARQDAAEKQYGAALLGDPSYTRFRDNPMDRSAGLDFYLHTRGAPGRIDDDFAGYVGSGINAQYARLGQDHAAALDKNLTEFRSGLDVATYKEKSLFGQGIDQQNAKFTQQLTQQNYDYAKANDLQLYKDKSAFDEEAKQHQLEQLQQLPGEMSTNAQFDLRFPNQRPANMSITANDAGELVFRPMSGSKEWTTMMTSLSANQTMQKRIAEMQTSLDRGDYSQSGWNSTVAQLQLLAKNLNATGALDHDTLEVLNKQIPSLSKADVFQNSGAIQEQLRATVIGLQSQMKDTVDTYNVPIHDLPKDKQDPRYFPQPRGEPPAEGSVSRANKAQGTAAPQQQPLSGPNYDPLNSPGASIFQ